MTRVGPCLFITISLVALLLVLASFSTVSFDNPPEQVISPRTGYLLWHPTIKDFDQQLTDAAALFTVITTFLSGYYIMRWMTDRKYTTIFVLDDVKMASTESFNYFLGGYCLFTSFAGVFLLWFDAGKIFATAGILHNAGEVVIMMAMHQGGKIVAGSTIGWLAFYVVFANGLSMLLDWPLDAVWFKMQGLCADFAIAIQFTRMYFNTKCHMRRDAIEGNPIVNEEGSTENHEALYLTPRVHHPQQILILIFASLVHIAGNVISTLYFTQLALIVFHLSYPIAFPAYAYFVYLDVNARSTYPHRIIRLPDTTHWKVIVVTISSITLGLLSTRIAYATTGMSNSD